ncbi:MAG: hypothetical protein KKE73_00365 [Proteobacteria bacterium]|nr:hypothetical protein [Pseudomonadota bacterium]
MDKKHKASDIIAIVAKGGLGAIPVIGPLAAEIVGRIIPNQRLDRLEDTLKRFRDNLDDEGLGMFKANMDNPEFIDLFEEAMLQAARALSDDRRENIARILKSGMTDEELNHMTKRRILEAFERTNDAEIILLQSGARKLNEDNEFKKQHEILFHIPDQTITGRPLEPSEAEAATMSKVYLKNLITLGLISDSSFEPDFIQLTSFGRQLLKYINNEPDADLDK